MRNSALALLLTLLSSSLFAATPAQLCHQEVLSQHEAAITAARTLYHSEMQRCLQFPYESDRFMACEGDAQMRLQVVTTQADEAYALARQECDTLL